MNPPDLTYIPRRPAREGKVVPPRARVGVSAPRPGRVRGGARRARGAGGRPRRRADGCALVRVARRRVGRAETRAARGFGACARGHRGRRTKKHADGAVRGRVPGGSRVRRVGVGVPQEGDPRQHARGVHAEKVQPAPRGERGLRQSPRRSRGVRGHVTNVPPRTKQAESPAPFAPCNP